MKKHFYIFAVLAMVLGLMMISAPSSFIKVLVILAGIASVASGAFAFFTARHLVDSPVFLWTVTGRSLLGVIVGLLAVILPLAIAKTAWTIMMYILATELAVSCLVQLYDVYMLKNNGVETKPFIGEILISAILSVVLFIMPATVGEIIVRVLGVVIVIAAVVLAVWTYKAKEKQNFIVGTVTEADAEDVEFSVED